MNNNEQKEVNIEEIVRNQFFLLPEKVKTVITESGWEKTLVKIGEKYHLDMDQIGKLENEVALTMIGYQDSYDFADGVAKILETRIDSLGDITEDIDIQIFRHIKEALTESQNFNDFNQTQTGQRPHNKTNTDDQINQQDILKEIEDSADSVPKITIPETKNPLEAHFSGPTTAPIINDAPQKSAPEQTTQPKIDPYREQVS